METDFVYKAKDICENKWVYGNYVDQTYGCVPLIITRAWMQDNGDVEFDYCFVDKDTVDRVKLYSPNYILSQYFNQVMPHCPHCNKILDEFEKPNFCSECGLALDWR